MAESHSDAAKVEQVITEIFAKSLHIILESRIPCASSSDPGGENADSGVRPRDEWFNLALKDCPAAFENLDIWSLGDLESMVIDLILVERVLESVSGDTEESKQESDRRSEKIIERWVVKYEIRRAEPEGSRKARKRWRKRILSTLYKRSVLMLRSLYTTVRLLPAYKLFRQLSLSGGLCSCFLAHRVSASADPLDPQEEARMQIHGFSPLDTSYGKLHISVLYLSRLPDVASQSSSVVMAPKFITDYVGSQLAQPVKSLPSHMEGPGSVPSRPYSLSNCHQSWAFPPSFTSSSSSAHSDSCALPPPHPLASASHSDRGADLMQGGVAVDKMSFLVKYERDKQKKQSTDVQDELNYYENTFAFDVARNDQMDTSSRQSRFASAGVLMDTFQRAQPLNRQGVPKMTVADALRELQGYKQMAESLKAKKLLRGTLKEQQRGVDRQGVHIID